MLKPAAIAITFSAAATIALCGCGSHATGTNTAAPTPSTPTTSQPVRIAPSPATPASKVRAWYAASGHQDLTDLKQDANAMSTDGQAGSLPAVLQDCKQFEADATRAQADPPPVDTHAYADAMGEYAQGGYECSIGSVDLAETYIDRGTAELGKVTADLAVALGVEGQDQV